MFSGENKPGKNNTIVYIYIYVSTHCYKSFKTVIIQRKLNHRRCGWFNSKQEVLYSNRFTCFKHVFTKKITAYLSCNKFQTPG